MPENDLLQPRRTIERDPAEITPPTRAPFVELGLASCFSFLRGASDAVDLVLTARALGYDAIGIADVNSMAGVVRIHTEAETLRLRPVIGCRIETVEGLAFLAYPTDRAAYGRLCRLISAGRMGTLDGGWQDKGVCQISLAMRIGLPSSSAAYLARSAAVISTAPWNCKDSALRAPAPASNSSVTRIVGKANCDSNRSPTVSGESTGSSR